MMGNRCVRIAIIVMLVAVMCGTVSAAVGLVVETQVTSAGEYPVCTAPCECISESTAALRWGAEGYEKCSKTICGQDAGGDVQYYCIHQVGSAVPSSAGVTTVPVATATTTAVQETTVNAPVTPVAVTTTPSSTWPGADAVPQETPVGIPTVLAAIGASLLAAHGMRRK